MPFAEELYGGFAGLGNAGPPSLGLLIFRAFQGSQSLKESGNEVPRLATDFAEPLLLGSRYSLRPRFLLLIDGIHPLFSCVPNAHLSPLGLDADLKASARISHFNGRS